jgi:hypothetical protein
LSKSGKAHGGSVMKVIACGKGLLAVAFEPRRTW